MIKTLLLSLSCLLINGCAQQQSVQCPTENVSVNIKTDKMSGLTLVAPPEPFTENPMVAIKAVHADWIAVVPYGFTRKGETKVYFNTQRQWWGERTEGIVETVKKAHEAGIKVMLKPQIYVPGDWTGTLNFETVAEWEKWEKGYEEYTLEMAKIAQDEGVDLFCFATEFKIAIQNRPEFWVGLIRKIRAVYQGSVTYAANWDNYNNIPFWSELDYVGINAYFPLCDTKNPTEAELTKAWQPVVKAIENFQCEVNKPIIFTEFGYLSVDACASKTWELEAKVHDIAINEAAQATALNALFSTFWDKNWWAGGFLWKWFPDMQGHEGYPEKDYTPQGKKAESIVKNWYGKKAKRSE